MLKIIQAILGAIFGMDDTRKTRYHTRGIPR